jgi:O-antigen/teichoic acid export membrane protein
MSGVLYGIATIATRALNLATIVTLTHLLAPAQLGTYVLAMTTAFALTSLLGSWLSASAYRYLAGEVGDDQVVTISTLGGGLLIVCPFLLLASIAMQWLGLVTMSVWDAALMGAFAAIMLVFDTTIASKNSMGQARAYAIASVVRNTASFLFVVGAVMVGWGVHGALAGQVLGVLAGLCTPSTWQIWRRVVICKVSLFRLRSFVVYGFIGAMVLGYYMVSHFVIRSLVGHHLGEEAAGAFGVVFDLMFGPIALFGVTLSLVHMPKIESETPGMEFPH